MFESLQLCFFQSHISHSYIFRWCQSEMSAHKVVGRNLSTNVNTECGCTGEVTVNTSFSKCPSTLSGKHSSLTIAF